MESNRGPPLLPGCTGALICTNRTSVLRPGMLSLDRRNRNRSTIGRAPCSRAAVLTLETPSKRSKTGRLSFVDAALFETYLNITREGYCESSSRNPGIRRCRHTGPSGKIDDQWRRKPIAEQPYTKIGGRRQAQAVVEPNRPDPGR